VTVCASNRVEDEVESPDECYGESTAHITRKGRVNFRAYCMENPGDRCTGLATASTIHLFGFPRKYFARRGERLRRGGEKFIHVSFRRRFAVDTGPRGVGFHFKVSRRTARLIRRASPRT
jgi:hypothetical protein